MDRSYQAGFTPDPGARLLLFLSLIEVTPCVLENDGMSLKPSIECNSRLKENFELKFKFDLAYVKEHTDPSADDLRNNIITEAIVSSLTTLDKKFSLP